MSKGFEDCFFVAPEGVASGRVTITGGEAKHITTVLRRRPGELITVADGRGHRFRIELTSCGSSEVVGEIRETEEFLREGPELWLGVGLIRTPRMDVLVEKCTELGVHTIVPLRTKRSLSSKGVSETRLVRWERIAAAAMTQSTRLFLPQILEPVLVEGFLEAMGPGSAVLLADHLGGSMGGVEKSLLYAPRIGGCVGPEGGFSPEEMGCLIKAGAVPVSLGQARLRTETAAMALLDRLSFLMEQSSSS
jgi:16S rRNA (uracil1498-N3)-methyltransferase